MELDKTMCFINRIKTVFYLLEHIYDQNVRNFLTEDLYLDTINTSDPSNFSSFFIRNHRCLELFCVLEIIEIGKNCSLKQVC